MVWLCKCHTHTDADTGRVRKLAQPGSCTSLAGWLAGWPITTTTIIKIIIILKGKKEAREVELLALRDAASRSLYLAACTDGRTDERTAQTKEADLQFKS